MKIIAQFEMNCVLIWLFVNAKNTYDAFGQSRLFARTKKGKHTTKKHIYKYVALRSFGILHVLRTNHANNKFDKCDLMT